MSFSLHSLQGSIWGIGVLKGDTRSLDYSSYCGGRSYSSEALDSEACAPTSHIGAQVQGCPPHSSKHVARLMQLAVWK